MPTIAIMNNKGGVTKTTTVINLSVQAAMRKKTLVVDTDEQASMSLQFGVENPKTTIKEALLGQKFDILNVRKNLDILPSDEELIAMDLLIYNKKNRQQLLAKSLKGIKDNYDYIFIDCPSNFSLVTANALAAADYVIIPMTLERMSEQGINKMVKFITEIKREHNPKLYILGLLIARYNPRVNVAKKVEQEIREKGWEGDLFKTRIRENVHISEGQLYNKDIFSYMRNSNGANDYVSLGNEVLRKINKLEKNGTK